MFGVKEVQQIEVIMENICYQIYLIERHKRFILIIYIGRNSSYYKYANNYFGNEYRL